MGTKLDELAHDLFDVVTWFCLAGPRGRRRGGELREIEFLTLSLLQQREPLIVGDIQRQLAVLPAQMSRIIRALEARERPLITCRINAHDKRKIDVALTPAGRLALQEHQSARVGAIAAVLATLPPEDLDDLHRLIGRLQAAFAHRAS